MSGAKGKDDKKLKDGVKKLSGGIDDVLKHTTELAQLKKELDKSDGSDTQSEKLQMTMDRLSKMMQTLSNLMKKVESTQGDIVQNLK